MNIKAITFGILIVISSLAFCQTGTEINKTDQQGRKQGHWIKKYPNKSVMYDGIFKDDHPVGAFRRYDENNRLTSMLVYSDDGKEAIVTTYHPNGYISSKGKYINQLKEGKWQFFSIGLNGHCITEETYSKNLRNGISIKFYSDSTIAEKIIYVNDKKEGEWLQYYLGGVISLRSTYLNDKVNGKYQIWFENGRLELSGTYKNDVRDGQWQIYNTDGTIKYTMQYVDGVTKDRQMDIDVSNYMDLLEKNKGKIADPEKTGIIQK